MVKAGKAAAERRIPTLDGLRAISILLVVISHLVVSRTLRTSFPEPFVVGELGVRIFFVLSGFLITTLILDEVDGTGRFDALAFYVRRTLKIWPPYFVYLAVVWGLAKLHQVQPRGVSESVWPAALFVSDYFTPSTWLYSHTWSLAVEEQFYLLWPAVLVLAGRRRALRGAVCVIVLAPVLRYAETAFRGHLPPGFEFRYSFECNADAIAVGCLLAAYRERLRAWRAWERFVRSPWFVLVPLSAYATEIFAMKMWSPKMPLFMPPFVLGRSLQAVGIAACIDWCLLFRDGRIARVLDAAPLAVLGRMSYSVYLWQALFISPLGGAQSRFPWNLLWLACAASASYLLIERPMQWLKRRLLAGRRPAVVATAPKATSRIARD